MQVKDKSTFLHKLKNINKKEPLPRVINQIVHYYLVYWIIFFFLILALFITVIMDEYRRFF